MNDTSGDEEQISIEGVHAFLVERKAELFEKKSFFGPKPFKDDDPKKDWILALTAAAFVRGAEDGLSPPISPRVSGAPFPRLDTIADHEEFLEFLIHEAPSWSFVMARAKDLVEAHWPKTKGTLPSHITATLKFATLARLEAAFIAKRKVNVPQDRVSPTIPAVGVIEAPGVSREPWVSQATHDHFGLVLSGGGIRSATFNLGLLQALGEKGVLRHVDYVSTVSGGGYVGGFWTAWRFHDAHRKTTSDQLFPVRAIGAGALERERPEIRHLREFSSFIVPRVGFAQSETWAAITAVLGGMLISVLVVGSAVAAAFYAWRLALLTMTESVLPAFSTFAPPHAAPTLVFATITLVFHLLSERRVWRLGKLRADEHPWFGYASGLGATVLAAAGWWCLLEFWKGTGAFGAHHVSLCAWLGKNSLDPESFRSVDPAIVWGATGMLLLLIRGLLQRLLKVSWSAALDRTISRCLAPALVALGVALLWCGATYLRTKADASVSVPGVGAGAVGSTGLFLWLFDWLKKPVEETHGSQLLDRIGGWLRPVLPQVAAAAAAILFLLGAAVFVHAFQNVWQAWVAVTAIAVSALFWFDPARNGLHEFYRARVARCFLGAARAEGSTDPAGAAATIADDRDDVTLGQLRDADTRGPLHLICCAANNLNGDVLGSLYRGARSAVLSPFGVSVGNFAAPRDDVKLSAALTASAAAFNSQMGGLSISLGPAVAFVMCALNLRLGLWCPHPLSRWQKSPWPGFHFYLEALGRSRSDQVWDRNFFGQLVAGGSSQLHLSDGGHFENLGLYELVRRHCRYVIVSDATADAASTFDDLGNAIRRVREDFGVEIDLDVSPLRPDERGYAKQHAVAGVIHYDGLDGTDKGMLIYFKPALTGDEPIDVLQYRAKNQHFPHDGTGDQFYDEAQWESYRRLGQHAAAALVSIPVEGTHGIFVDKLFHLARQRLEVVDPALDESFLELTGRCQQLASDLRDNAPPGMLAEFFPEVAVADPTAAPPSPAATETDGSDSERVAYAVMMLAQAMEDVWYSAKLDTLWAHPLNEGWMSYFRRWTSTPSFRTWWPILRPIYSPGFRDFIRERFGIQLNEPARNQRGPGARLELRPFESRDEDGLALKERRRFRSDARPPTFVYALELEGASPGTYLAPIQVALLWLRNEGSDICWDADDFYVLPSLAGSGIESRFLDAVVAELEQQHALRVKVESGAVPASDRDRKRRHFRSPAARNELVSRLNFYKSRGFRYELDPSRQRSPDDDTVLVRPRCQGPSSGNV